MYTQYLSMHHSLALSISNYQLILEAELRKYILMDIQSQQKKILVCSLQKQLTSGMNEEKALHLSLLFYTPRLFFIPCQIPVSAAQTCRRNNVLILSLLPFFSLKTYAAVNTRHELCLYVSEYFSLTQMRFKVTEELLSKI